MFGYLSYIQGQVIPAEAQIQFRKPFWTSRSASLKGAGNSAHARLPVFRLNKINTFKWELKKSLRVSCSVSLLTGMFVLLIFPNSD